MRPDLPPHRTRKGLRADGRTYGGAVDTADGRAVCWTHPAAYVDPYSRTVAEPDDHADAGPYRRAHTSADDTGAVAQPVRLAVADADYAGADEVPAGLGKPYGEPGDFADAAAERHADAEAYAGSDAAPDADAYPVSDAAPDSRASAIAYLAADAAADARAHHQDDGRADAPADRRAQWKSDLRERLQGEPLRRARRVGLDLLQGQAALVLLLRLRPAPGKHRTHWLERLLLLLGPREELFARLRLRTRVLSRRISVAPGPVRRPAQQDGLP